MQLFKRDCLKILPQIPERSIDMILCELPYGTTSCLWDTPIPFDALWTQYRRIIKPHCAICLFGSEPFSSALRMSNLKEFKYDWIWEKSKSGSAFTAKYRPVCKHETISVFLISGNALYLKLSLWHHNSIVNGYPTHASSIIQKSFS